ncbi:MAG: hypothetical protein AB7E05_00720 [Sphingobium sp.]
MIGSTGRWVMGLAATAAVLVGSVEPAVARGYGGWGSGGWSSGGWGGGYHHRPYRRDRGLNAGEVIGIAALIGAVAVIASSASKNKDAKNRADRRSYPDDRDYRNDDGAYAGDGNYDDAPQPGNPSAPAMSADQAADACAVAVRDKVEGEQGGYAQIVDIAEPRAAAQDGWAVDGRVERRSGYRDGAGEVRRFSCDVEGQQVAHVYISLDAG